MCKFLGIPRDSKGKVNFPKPITRKMVVTLLGKRQIFNFKVTNIPGQVVYE